MHVVLGLTPTIFFNATNFQVIFFLFFKQVMLCWGNFIRKNLRKTKHFKKLVHWGWCENHPKKSGCSHEGWILPYSINNIPLTQVVERWQGVIRSYLDHVEHYCAKAHPTKCNGQILVNCYQLGKENWTFFTLTLDMNVFLVRYELMPKPKFGRVYHIKNAKSMGEGFMYNVVIEQYSHYTCPNNEIRNYARTK